MIRKTIGVVAGFIVGGICVSILHYVGDAMFPFPDSVDRNNMQSLAEYMPNMPLGAFVMVWLAHGSGALVSAAICTAVVGSRWYLGAWILGTVYTFAGIAMSFMLPGPIWFEAVDLLLYIPLALAGCYLVGICQSDHPGAKSSDNATSKTGA